MNSPSLPLQVTMSRRPTASWWARSPTWSTVYAAAEEGLWVDDATRTTTTEMAEMIADGQITVARRDGQIVGSVRVQQLDRRTGEFGLLVTDPARRGEGSAESW